MNLKIISGAQTGADVAGLWAAKLFGIPTGGYAPNGFLTLDGNHPEMAKTFGIKEHPKTGYRDRTISNIYAANLTIILSEKMSPGTKLTINTCAKTNAEHFILTLDSSDMGASIVNSHVDFVIERVRALHMVLDPMVINIAGNSTKNSPRTFEFVFKFCFELFTNLGYVTEAKPEDWKIYQDKWE